METGIASQALAILKSIALGIALGLVYDILRPPRRGLGGITAVLLDAAFCLLAGAGLFCIAMSSNSGRLGTWELAGALAGFLLYMHTLSHRFLCIFTYVYDSGVKALKRLTSAVKKLCKMIKFFFQNQIKCIIMKKQRDDPAEETP